MSESGKAAPVTEWILTDVESQRRAIRGMMGLRKLILETLGNKMGGRMLFSGFLGGKQKGLYVQSLIDAAEAMDCEVVIRPKREDKLAQRLQMIRSERGRKKGVGKAPQVADDSVAPDDPDRDLKLRLLAGMKDAGNRRDLEQVFRDIREAGAA